jgi:hypothetical protein
MRDGDRCNQEVAAKRIRALEADLAAVREENRELNELFDLQHARTVEATKAWREATGRHNVSPDLGVLLTWMLKENRRLREALEEIVAFEPEFVPVPEEFKNRECADCDRAEKGGWPPSGLCDKHYTMLHKNNDANERLRAAQYLDMKIIARAALAPIEPTAEPDDACPMCDSVTPRSDCPKCGRPEPEAEPSEAREEPSDD